MGLKNLSANKKLAAIVIAAVVVIALLVWWIMSMHSSSNTGSTRNKGTTPPKAVDTAVVEITPSGFVPSTISVKPDTDVVWVNEDVMPHLPAADPYPSHSSLPSLVAPRALGQKETYTYLFTRSGTIHYHDDLNPLMTGTVEVE